MGTRNFVSKAKNKKFRSGFEEKFAAYLKAKRVFYKYEDSRIPYEIVLHNNYLPDFELKKADGDTMYVECKGYFTAFDRKKLLAVRATNISIDLRIIFQYDNWMTKKRKKRYSDWCKDNGFKYHVGASLPKEWIDELG
jgi:predicted nuclease of restriction endonuclease-like RecB superfamily